jgi:alpha-beta hydrolase superfamily lysophospholipase
MLQLSSDKTFHFELLRVMGSARSYGADVAEILGVAEKLIPGNFESWAAEFQALAEHIADETKKITYPVTERNAYFRISSYYRAADFFLHGKAEDPRIMQLWAKQTEYFDRAISKMDLPGIRHLIKAEGFDIPTIYYKARNDNEIRPTLLLCNGYDGSQEEMLHAFGFAALERGFNVITFEGPGQPTVMREQNRGFITEWERVVTPVIDHYSGYSEIDEKKLILLGYSFGGFLIPRSVAFEHRISAAVCVDGIFDAHQAFLNDIPESTRKLLEAGMEAEFDAAINSAKQYNTGLRWAIEQGCWSFKAATPFDFLKKSADMSLKNIYQNIKCPVLVLEAEKDHVFAGQPVQLANALGDLATYVKLGVADCAEEHCHVGAVDRSTGIVMDWIAAVLQR